MAKASKAPIFLEEPAPIFEGFSKETFKFLHGLKKNNNKEWFEDHREDYDMHLRNPSKALAYAMGEYFKNNKMPVVGNAKTSLFRINRDIRFSKDKSPYKTHVGLSFPLEGGTKEEWAGFYIGFEPAKTGKDVTVFAGGGVYMPPPQFLRRIRAKIDSEHKSLKKMLASSSFTSLYPKGLTGDSLKRIPSGYSEEHPAAEFLKLKSFLFNAEVESSDLLNEEFPHILGAKFKAALPIVQFLGKS